MGNEVASLFSCLVCSAIKPGVETQGLLLVHLNRNRASSASAIKELNIGPRAKTGEFLSGLPCLAHLAHWVAMGKSLKSVL